MFYPRYNTYVKFNSKADVSEYLWGNRKRSNDLDWYLARIENKPPLLFKKTLTFFHLSEIPKDINIITAAQYNNLIGSTRYLHKEDFI
jgi:hypothetical protein